MFYKVFPQILKEYFLAGSLRWRNYLISPNCCRWCSSFLLQIEAQNSCTILRGYQL
jgi:hypothetical protein